MTPTDKYAIAIGAICAVLLATNYPWVVRRLVDAFGRFWTRFSYIRVPRRFGSWHLNTALLLAILLGVNMYLTFFNGFFNLVSAEEMSIRSANLSLINLIPVMAGPSQSFLASRVFGISFKTFQKVHRSLALASTLLLAIHIAAALAPRGGFSLQVMSNVWAVAVSR